MLIKALDNVALHVRANKRENEIYYFWELGIRSEGFTYDSKGRKINEPEYTIGCRESDLMLLRSFFVDLDLKNIKEWKQKSITEMNKV